MSTLPAPSPNDRRERAREWIDISRPLHPGMIGWPEDPDFTRTMLSRITESGGSNLSAISMSSHAGTHIDAPLHCIPGGAGVDQIPLNVLCGEAVVVDVAERRHVCPDDFAAMDIRRGDRVLFKTANLALWDRPSFDSSYFGLSLEASKSLVDLGVSLVGIDYLSIEPYENADMASHRLLLFAGIVILEGLDLSGVAAGRYEMIALPLRIVGGDGGPARVILRAI